MQVHTDLLALEQKEMASDRAHVTHPILLRIDGQTPENSVIP